MRYKYDMKKVIKCYFKDFTTDVLYPPAERVHFLYPGSLLAVYEVFNDVYFKGQMCPLLSLKENGFIF